MAQFTNETGVSLDLAVWLLHDEYDYIDKDNYISVTSLMKPTRMIILGSRVSSGDRQIDVSDFIASALGKSIHDSIEKGMDDGSENKLKRLGYSENVIDRILVNPTHEAGSENRSHPRLYRTAGFPGPSRLHHWRQVRHGD